MIIRLLYVVIFFIKLITALPSQTDVKQTIKINSNNETELYQYISDGLSKLTEQYKKDPNGTITELQDGFKRASDDGATLPRWTRGEIIDTLDNITNTDPKDIIDTIANSRQLHQRAIMLVMPYTPKDTDHFNIEELYTKPPVTHIIGTETTKPQVTSRLVPSKNNYEILAPEVSTYRPPMHKRPVKPLKVTKTPLQKHEQVWEPTHLAEETPTTARSHKPSKPSIPKEPIDDLYLPDERPRKEVFVKQEAPLHVRKTPVKPVRFANHKYSEEEPDSPNQGMRVITAPTLVTKAESLDTDYWPQSSKLVKQTTENKPQRLESVDTDYWPQPLEPVKQNIDNKPQRLVRPNPVQSSVYKAPSSTVRPRHRITTTTIPITTTKATTTKSPLENIGVPDDMKDLVKDIAYGIVPQVKPQKYSSQYDASSITFPKSQKMENVQDILDSIGAVPLHTSTTPIPDISEIADSLSPEMRELLISFGLLESPNPKSTTTTTTPRARLEPDLDPYSYTQFKPLPDSAPSRQDMQHFLASFGLTGNSQRSAKQLQPTEAPTHLSQVPAIEMDMLPDSMHDVLADIGLAHRKQKKLEESPTHVFSPDNTYITEEEIKKVNQLLEAIKQLDKLNRTATPDDLKDMTLEDIRDFKKLLKIESTIPLDQQNPGPDPLEFDFGLAKNEVKRQENSTTSTTTEEPRNPSLEALEESFGGSVSENVTSQPEMTVPPTRRTGFYYLLDWNSFLEVGEEDKKVNIRFSPKAGDPSRFLRINVP